MWELLRRLNFIGSTHGRYIKFKNNPKVKAKTFVFGIYSIVQSLSACVLGIIALLLLTVINTGGFVGIIFGIIFGAGLGLCAISLLIASLLSLIYLNVPLDTLPLPYLFLQLLLLALLQFLYFKKYRN